MAVCGCVRACVAVRGRMLSLALLPGRVRGTSDLEMCSGHYTDTGKLLYTNYCIILFVLY